MSIRIEIKQTVDTAAELEETLKATGNGLAAMRMALDKQGFGYPEATLEISQGNTERVKEYATDPAGELVELGFKSRRLLIPVGTRDPETGLPLFKIEEAFNGGS